MRAGAWTKRTSRLGQPSRRFPVWLALKVQPCMPFDLIDDCPTRCRGARYHGLFREPTLNCLVEAEDCNAVAWCVVGDDICEEACESLTACGIRPATCQSWCAATAITGGFSREQLNCMAEAHDKGRCDDVEEMCLYGRRSQWDGECGIYPEHRCWGLSGCSCHIAWRPCDPRLTCTDCSRACMKFLGCTYNGQANSGHRANCMAGCEAAWSQETIECFARLPSGNIQGKDCDMAQMNLCLGH